MTIFSFSDPEPDPDSGVFWIRIQGLKKIKMLIHHKIILLFKTIFLSIDFFWWENLRIINLFYFDFR